MSDTRITFHVILYIDWRNGGSTTCCRRPVGDLPKTDVYGPDWRGREPGHRRCPGEERAS